MARSVKKGPFIDAHLAKKLRLPQVIAIVSQLKPGQEDQQSYLTLSVLPLQSIMENSIYL